MYFDTNLQVLINGQKLTTIVAVKTSNDASQVGASAEIIVPLNCLIEYSNPNNLEVFLTEVRADTFPQGSTISIIANYVGLPTVQVFSGYVYDYLLGMPCTIKCLDYIYWMNIGIFGDQRETIFNKSKTKVKKSGIGVNYKSVQFKDLLQQLIDFTNQTIDSEAPGTPHISLMLPTFDMELQNLTFINMSPAAILEWFKKTLGLNISFFGSQLYVNLASNTVGSIDLDTSVNVIKSELQTRKQSSVSKNGAVTKSALPTAFERIRVQCWFIRSDGSRDSLTVGDENGIQIEQFFYNIKREAGLYERMANEALYKARTHHYKGSLEVLLYPVADLFYIVNYVDVRYPEKSGQYYITGLYYDISERGFHRKLKLAWLAIPTDS